MKFLLDTLLVIVFLIISDRIHSQEVLDIGVTPDDMLYREMLLLDIEREIEELTSLVSESEIQFQALNEHRQLVLNTLNECGCSREKRSSLIDELQRYDIDIDTINAEIEKIYARLDELNQKYEAELENRD